MREDGVQGLGLSWRYKYGVISIKIAFKAMGLDKSIKGVEYR